MTVVYFNNDEGEIRCFGVQCNRDAYKGIHHISANSWVLCALNITNESRINCHYIFSAEG